MPTIRDILVLGSRSVRVAEECFQLVAVDGVATVV